VLNYGQAKLGSIEAGKLADFIVIDRNILEIPTEEINKTKVASTVVGGEVVFQSKLV
jgi:predicted amidohydrolase YtcJ